MRRGQAAGLVTGDVRNMSNTKEAEVGTFMLHVPYVSGLKLQKEVLQALLACSPVVNRWGEISL